MLLFILINALQNLLESPVDRRAHSLALVEVNGGRSALADALRSELEFLKSLLAHIHTRKREIGENNSNKHTLYTSL